MRRIPSSILLILWLVGAAGAPGDEPIRQAALIPKPEAFPALVHPLCSHCLVEANRRKDELRADDRVLCWVQVATDGYINDGVIPLRFFMNTHRVLDDSWGQFVYDPDAGFARGFAPDAGSFRFYGWRNGVMVMKNEKDGSLYSCLTGIAFEGPAKGKRLQPRPTLVSDWDFWRKRYPKAVAYTMDNKYQPVELPSALNEDSLKSRGPADARLPADTEVLGVWDGSQARAYPLDVVEKAGVIHDLAGDRPRLILWYGPTRTAAAYHQPFGTSGLAGDVGWIFHADGKIAEAPFVDERTGLHWDITGRPAEGGPRLVWLDSVQVKWFAWAAEYPETSIYGKEGPQADYKPLSEKSLDIAGPFGNLDVNSRRFGILKAVNPQHRQITLLLEGETEPRPWPVRPDAEIWRDGWWGRLDQVTLGDRVWVWFQKGDAGEPLAIWLLADELSEQDLYGPVKVKAVDASASDEATVALESSRSGKPSERTVKLAKAQIYRGNTRAARESLKVGEILHVQTTGEDARLILNDAAFETRRTLQKSVLRKRWVDEGLPGTLIFVHPERKEIELMLDHEAMQWGRSLQPGNKVVVNAPSPFAGFVERLRPWRERTQVVLKAERSDAAELRVGQRVHLRLPGPPLGDGSLPAGLGKSANKQERIEWLMSSMYCTCGMHDECAGHTLTLSACDAFSDKPCGLAKRTREEIAVMLDQKMTDQQIFEKLLRDRGANLLRPHMSP